MSGAAFPGARRPHVLVVTLRYPPYVAGGYELLTRDAVEALRARGYRVSVLSAKGQQLQGLPEVYPLLEPDLDGQDDLFGASFSASNRKRFSYHFYSAANARAATQALAQSGAELMLYFNLGLVSLAPIVAARRAGLPTLGYISDPWPLNHWLLAWSGDARQRKKALRLKFLGLLWRAYSRWVGFGALLTCSDYLQTRLRAGGVASQDLCTLHLGVPPDMQALAAGRSLPVRASGEPLRIACISSFWEGKGQGVLLAALELLHTRGLSIELTLAGSGGGAYLEGLRRQAEGLGQRVRFERDLDREAVSSLLAESHVLVVPSTWGEPFPLASLEGMAHGCALVVSAAGGSPEAIVDGEHGLLVPASDAQALGLALERLERDEELRQRLAAAGRERARGALSHSAFVDGLELAMQRALGGRP